MMSALQYVPFIISKPGQVGKMTHAIVESTSGTMLNKIAQRLIAWSFGRNRMMMALNNGKNVIALSIENPPKR
jgi:hypothetical protein